jgi:hypothetical protein
VNAEFNWWLLIVGLVVGAGLVWLILAEAARREVDVDRRERAGEARWIAAELRRAGDPLSDETVAEILDLHAAYLAAPPPDEPPEAERQPASESDVAAGEPRPDDRPRATVTSVGSGSQPSAMAHSGTSGAGRDGDRRQF